jgi:putative SOS response-associated peptidase YedK
VEERGKTRQPYCFEVNDGELFAFAGLWDRWMNHQGKRIESCTILTTTPNSLLTDIRDRMPVILSPDKYAFDPTIMRRYPVSTRVNQVLNDDEDFTEKFPHASRQYACQLLPR